MLVIYYCLVFVTKWLRPAVFWRGADWCVRRAGVSQDLPLFVLGGRCLADVDVGPHFLTGFGAVWNDSARLGPIAIAMLWLFNDRYAAAVIYRA